MDDSVYSNDNNMRISLMQLAAIANRQTVDDTNEDLEKQNNEIRLWLESISYPEYFNNFVLSGYDSIEFIKAIRNESELIEIGVSSKTECNKILCEIEKLRMIAIPATKDGVETFEIVDENTKTADANEGEPGNVQIEDETKR